MLEVLARHWWATVLRGVLAMMFGLTALILPQIALLALVVFFGAFALVDGLFAMSATIWAARHEAIQVSLSLESATGIVIGVLAFLRPGITEPALVYLIAVWAIMVGVFRTAAALRLREELQGDWLLAMFPTVGATAVVWLFGAFLLVIGIVTVTVAVRLHRWYEDHFGHVVPI